MIGKEVIAKGLKRLPLDRRVSFLIIDRGKQIAEVRVSRTGSIESGNPLVPQMLKIAPQTAITCAFIKAFKNEAGESSDKQILKEQLNITISGTKATRRKVAAFVAEALEEAGSPEKGRNLSYITLETSRKI